MSPEEQAAAISGFYLGIACSILAYVCAELVLGFIRWVHRKRSTRRAR